MELGDTVIDRFQMLQCCMWTLIRLSPETKISPNTIIKCKDCGSKLRITIRKDEEGEDSIHAWTSEWPE